MGKRARGGSAPTPSPRKAVSAAGSEVKLVKPGRDLAWSMGKLTAVSPEAMMFQHPTGDSAYKFVELGAGEAGLSKEHKALGASILPIDILYRWAEHDLVRQAVTDVVCEVVTKEADVVHSAIPCNTYSCCRYPTLRTKAFPDGLPDLKRKDQIIVLKANILAENMLRIVNDAAEQGIPWTVENPNGSVFWHCAAYRVIYEKYQPLTVKFDMCRYGADFKKRMYILQ